MKVEIFLASSCSHRATSEQIVKEAMADSGVEGAPEVVMVSDYEDAKARRVFGSPTVRVNGVDVEYGDREPEEFTTGCRYYNSAEGWQPFPRKELVVRGIEVARARERRQAAG